MCTDNQIIIFSLEEMDRMNMFVGELKDLIQKTDHPQIRSVINHLDSLKAVMNVKNLANTTHRINGFLVSMYKDNDEVGNEIKELCIKYIKPNSFIGNILSMPIEEDQLG